MGYNIKISNFKFQMNTKFTNKVIMLEEALKFEHAIIVLWAKYNIG
jgi:hypothetical protein